MSTTTCRQGLTAGKADEPFRLLTPNGALLQAYPVVGCFEDAIWGQDIEQYREVRLAAKRPLVMHGGPFGNTHEVVMRAADVRVTPLPSIISPTQAPPRHSR